MVLGQPYDGQRPETAAAGERIRRIAPPSPRKAFDARFFRPIESEEKFSEGDAAMRSWRVAFVCGLFSVLASGAAHAQQVAVSTPFQTLNDSWYENIGVSWGVRPGAFRNFFFNGPGLAPPPFGNPDPNSDARFGFGIGPFNFNFVAGQGNNRSMSTQIPRVVVPNGFGGSISDTSIRPFVTGIIPVVGDRRRMAETLTLVRDEQRRAEEERTRRDEREDKRIIQQEQQRLAVLRQKVAQGEQPALVLIGNQGDASAALQRLISRAESLEREGKKRAARIYYQQAARKASGALKGRLRAKIRALKP